MKSGPNPDHLSALQGCLIGTATGDALGLPAEGLSARRIELRWQGQWRMRLLFGRGMFSDDTEHTFAVAQAMAAAPQNVETFQRDLASRLRWWFLALPAGVGMATAKACIRLWLGIPPQRSGVFSAGNGPAMRSAIIGAFFRTDPEKRQAFVRASTRLTHTDPKAEAAAQAVAAAAAAAASGKDFTEVVAALHTWSQEPEWQKAVTLMREHLSAASPTQTYAAALGLERGVSGYAFHTVPVALYACFRHPDDFRSALTSLLDCGGDTDTTGAIAGGIAGARCGIAGIPEEWTNALCDFPLSASKLKAAAASLVEGRPVASLFGPARLLRNMAFLLIVLGHGVRRLFPP